MIGRIPKTADRIPSRISWSTEVPGPVSSGAQWYGQRVEPLCRFCSGSHTHLVGSNKCLDIPIHAMPALPALLSQKSLSKGLLGRTCGPRGALWLCWRWVQTACLGGLGKVGLLRGLTWHMLWWEATWHGVFGDQLIWQDKIKLGEGETLPGRVGRPSSYDASRASFSTKSSWSHHCSFSAGISWCK